MAEHKYQAGLKLIEAGDHHTGVEQLGQAAEMWLKSAYFRFMKSQLGLPRITSEITSVHLRNSAGAGQHLGVPYDPEGFHSLLFWAALLIAARQEQSRALTAERAQALFSRTRQLHEIWMLEYRYQPRDYQWPDVLLMRANVTWLRDMHTHLWR